MKHRNITIDRDVNYKCRVSGVAFSRDGCILFRKDDQYPMAGFTENLMNFFAGKIFRWLKCLFKTKNDPFAINASLAKRRNWGNYGEYCQNQLN